jgi:hypothetical protein
MHRLLTLCLAAGWLSLAGSLHAAAPAPQAIYDNTVLVMHFDIAAATPQTITAMFNAIAPQAGKDIDKMRDDLITKRNELAAMGVTDLTSTLSVDDQGEVPVMAARLGDNADPDKVAKWLADNGPSGEMLTVPLDDGLVLAWPIDKKLVGEPSKAVADRLAAATKAVGAGPMIIAFLPNEEFQKMFAEHAQHMRGQQKMAAMLAVTAARANWIIGSMQPGPKPSVTMIAEMPDRNSAEQLSTLWMGTVRIGQQMMMAMASQQGGDVPDLEPVVQALTPKVEGGRATVAIDAPTAKTIATTVLPSVIAARNTARRAVLASNMRQAMVGVITYTVDYGGQFPPDLDAVVKGGYIDKASWKKINEHPTGGYSPAFVYVKPDAAQINGLKDPTKTAVLIEADKQGKPKKDGFAAYADGHVQKQEKPKPTTE